MRATSSYRNIRNFLSGVFREAVGEGAVDFNPVRDAMVMTGKHSDTHAYTMKEVRSINNAVSDHTARTALMVLTFTGLRKGEVKGLRCEDYDKKAGVLNVQRAVTVKGEMKNPKTRASKAPVPVIDIVAHELAAHLKMTSGDGFIFRQKDSPALLNFEHMVYDVVRPALKRAGVEWHGLHAFRRGLNTTMKELGVDKTTRVDIMRHEQRDVTDKHYGKASLAQMRKALELVETEYKKTGRKR
jgi:integrase